MNCTVRPMHPTDLPSVLLIQRESFADATLESHQSFLVKLQASPGTCFVAADGAGLAGYLVALIADSAHPPSLNADHYTLPPAPDCLYLHDLSVARRARGAGVADALIAQFLRALGQLGLPRACLTAVNDSTRYWTRHGFEVVASGGAGPLGDRVATYGAGAQYMVRQMPPAP